MMSVVKQLNHF